MVNDQKLVMAMKKVAEWTVGGALGGAVVLLASADTVTNLAFVATGILFLLAIAIVYKIPEDEEIAEAFGNTQQESS